MKEVLIDTDILSYYFKGDNNVFLNAEKYLDHFNTLKISIITYYEIYSGLKYKRANRQLEIFEKFSNENAILPLTKNSCKISSDIYARQRQNGNVIDDTDLLIAGIAIENDLVLVTNNERHFEKIKELRIVNWKKE
ncbi:tRNA(fMet)-specific endonuclease VapC [subsurface metagenome]